MTAAGDKIRSFIREELLLGDSDATLADDTPLLEGIIESLGLIQLIAFIEEEFGVEIADGDITAEHFRTVADIEKLVAASAGG